MRFPPVGAAHRAARNLDLPFVNSCGHLSLLSIVTGKGATKICPCDGTQRARSVCQRRGTEGEPRVGEPRPLLGRAGLARQAGLARGRAGLARQARGRARGRAGRARRAGPTPVPLVPLVPPVLLSLTFQHFNLSTWLSPRVLLELKPQTQRGAPWQNAKSRNSPPESTISSP